MHNIKTTKVNEHEDKRQEMQTILSIIPLDNKLLLMYEFDIFIEENRLIMPFVTEN